MYLNCGFKLMWMILAFSALLTNSSEEGLGNLGLNVDSNPFLVETKVRDLSTYASMHAE